MSVRLSALLLLLCLALVLQSAPGCTHDRSDPGTSEMNAPDAGGPIDFMESCDPTDDRCDEGLTCFPFNAKGPHCTHSCTRDDECAEPSPGCNMMGVCKVP